ncbi:hypothetical protein LguiB_028456 [Lonicera macranthoides]
MDEVEEPPQTNHEEEALRLKTLAEQKYNSSNLKSAHKFAKKAHRLSPDIDGLSEMLTAFKILRTSAKSTTAPNWYKILQVEPFSHINTIKKQYKKLALTLHPDKTAFSASEEAFKLVGEGFRVLSDKIRRKEYDMKLRIEIQAAAEREMGGGGAAVAVPTFWTACSTCQLLHKFERRYLGHNLMCPSCKKSFKAIEVPDNVSDGEDDRIQTRFSTRVRVRNSGNLGKMSNVEESSERSRSKRPRTERSQNVDVNKGSRRVERSNDLGKREKKSNGEEMTLAEMQMLAKRKLQAEKLKSKGKGKEKGKENEKEKGGASENVDLKEQSASNGEDTGVMTVDDSDFYDFDKDRVERSFKKGQVWAVYDDDDGMPRHYGLIDEVVSTYPFEVKMSWLDLQNNGDEGLISWEELGFHISCGRFKVSKKTSVDSLNIFSHVVDCDRAARELYRVYPKKGSVWALYNENALDSEGRNLLIKDKRCYDIVVFLTSYSEIHGLSMGYLEKVDGFKTVFKRKQIGCNAVRWLEKDDVRMFSHQIPARKLSGEEASGLPKDCWELDPASLPPELLTIGWRK